MDSPEGNVSRYGYPPLPIQKKVKKIPNGWKTIGIALLIILSAFVITFILMYSNDSFKTNINQNITCPVQPACPTIPSCPECPECQEQRCECNFPGINLTCNFPNNIS
jgi:hypothetical protein